MSLGVFSAGGVIFSSFRVLRQMPGESQAQNRGAVTFPLSWAFQGSVVFCSVTPWGVEGWGMGVPEGGDCRRLWRLLLV